MSSVPTILLRVLSPRIAAKAVQAFDRATIVVVATCWAAAAVVLAATIYTVMASASARRADDQALAQEPLLPKIVHNNIENKNIQVLVDRMQHRYNTITFSAQANRLRISSTDGTKFRDWLMALSYIDTISPEYHWTIQDFCVGKCKGDIMSATLAAEKITFTAPDDKDKDKDKK
jgi:hypothetical protein